MTVRKNFIFDEETAKQLEELAKEEGKTQTQITQEALKMYIKEKKKEKKLQVLERLKGSLTGKIGNFDLKEVRIERALRRAE